MILYSKKSLAMLCTAIDDMQEQAIVDALQKVYNWFNARYETPKSFDDRRLAGNTIKHAGFMWRLTSRFGSLQCSDGNVLKGNFIDQLCHAMGQADVEALLFLVHCHPTMPIDEAFQNGHYQTLILAFV